MFKPAIATAIKEEILGKVKSGEKVPVIAQQYGISEKTIYTWLRRKALGTISILEYNRLKSENQQLKEIVGVLTVELTKLKKKKRDLGFN